MATVRNNGDECATTALETFSECARRVFVITAHYRGVHVWLLRTPNVGHKRQKIQNGIENRSPHTRIHWRKNTHIHKSDGAHRQSSPLNTNGFLSVSERERRERERQITDWLFRLNGLNFWLFFSFFLSLHHLDRVLGWNWIKSDFAVPSVERSYQFIKTYMD